MPIKKHPASRHGAAGFLGAALLPDGRLKIRGGWMPKNLTARKD